MDIFELEKEFNLINCDIADLLESLDDFSHGTYSTVSTIEGNATSLIDKIEDSAACLIDKIEVENIADIVVSFEDFTDFIVSGIRGTVSSVSEFEDSTTDAMEEKIDIIRVDLERLYDILKDFIKKK